MVAIFSYLFPIEQEKFNEANVKLITLSNYDAVLEEAVATDYIKGHDMETLKEWRKAPSEWDPKK